jgi:proliferating cell nuclear antigen
MAITFRSKTGDAYVLKILCELLQNNIRKACFELSADGIKLCMADSYHQILINLDLQSENFSVYKFKQETRYIGINMIHLHKMLKTIKKKDSITLFIDDDEPNDLWIKVFPKENNGRVTESSVKIQSMQYIDTEFPTGYGKPVIVPSAEYQKMTKEINNVGSVLTVYSKGFFIKFLSDPSSAYKKNVTLGEIEDDSEDEDIQEDNNEEYRQEFKTEMLNRIAKISGLSTNMQIFPREGLPLLFKSSVGSLGKISIYVKSKEQIEAEDHAVEESDYDSETETEVEQPVKNNRVKK